MKKHLRGVVAIAALAIVLGLLIFLVWGGNSPAEKLMKDHPYTFLTDKTLGTEKHDSYVEGEGAVYLAYPKTKNKETDAAVEEFLTAAKDEFAALLEERKEADEESENVEIPRLVCDYTTQKSGDYTVLTLSYAIELLNEEGAAAPGATPTVGTASYCIGTKNEILDLDGILGENGEAKIKNMLKVRDVALDKMEHFTVEGDVLTLHFEDDAVEFSIEAVKKANLIDPDKPMVAITFDDGPGGYSKEIADLFEKYDGRTTFFVLGSLVPHYEEELQYVYSKGHEVGSHTQNHKNLNKLSRAGVEEELGDARDAIYDAIGVYPAITRTPYGNANATVMDVMEGPMIHWSVDSEDWKSRNADTIVQEVLRNTGDGDIVLLHEIYGFSYNATKTILKKLSDKGYQFVTVSELLQYKGIEPEGIIYSTERQKTSDY